MSDRIYVMAEGTITGELPAEEATEETVMAMATRTREVPVDENSKSKRFSFPGSAAPQAQQSLGAEVQLLRENIREYAMYIALVVIFIIYHCHTRPVRFTPQHVNLVNQTGYVAVLAIGMT